MEQLKRSELLKKKKKKYKTNTHNTAALSSNVKGWAPRIQGASLMHLSWFSHQLTLLFTLRRWKTNTHKYWMHVLNAWGVRRDLSSFGCCVVVDVVCQRPDATLNIPGRGDGGDGGVGGDSCYMVCLQCHLLSWQARSHAHTQTQKCSLTWIHLLYLTDGGWRGVGGWWGW